MPLNPQGRRGDRPVSPQPCLSLQFCRREATKEKGINMNRKVLLYFFTSFRCFSFSTLLHLLYPQQFSLFVLQIFSSYLVCPSMMFDLLCNLPSISFVSIFFCTILSHLKFYSLPHINNLSASWLQYAQRDLHFYIVILRIIII